jgi:hypothetical protein
MKAFLTLVSVLAVGCGDLAAAESVDYVRDIKPLLAERCFACHGALRERSGLRLDAAELILRGGDIGPAVIPQQSGESPLWLVLSGAEEYPRMPPEGEGVPFEPEQVQLIRDWIDQGAKAPPEEIPEDPRRHWAYQPPVRAPLPEGRSVSGTATVGVRHPIDRFLSVERQARGLKAATAARRDVLLRRVYLDLVGLPPTRQELHAFLADKNPDAYEQVVDRLLASPRYGERWGRHWMDVWRYTDWFGLPNKMRHSQKHIWRWRDWIVESLNDDKGYDRMVLEMLAGDELAPDDPEVVRGTGYLARSWYLYNRNTWLDDVIEHTGKAFLGVTFNCVKCHEHKYDPITHEDYYRFRAFFEPHRVRLDPVGTQVDFEKDGLPRAYDADLDTKTYLFVRGDEERPDKERTHSPGVPAVLGSVEGTIEPRSLSVEAYYPMLRSSAREGLVQVAAQAVVDAQETLSEKMSEMASLTAQIDTLAAEGGRQAGGELRPGGRAQLDVSLVQKQRERVLAEKTLRVKMAEAAALRARLTADEARYKLSIEDGEFAKLAGQASEAERLLAVRVADASVTTSEQSLTKVEEAVAESAEKKRENLANAEKALSEAQEKLVAAREATEQPRSTEYTSAGTVYPTTTSGRRLALARWIVSRENSLAARVAVNHIWMRHFGAPLVDSVFDFGLRAPRPVHQKLLDWLALELMESGWSMKGFHRLLVTSGAYRMHSGAGARSTDRNFELDPDNRLLWRFNPRRMDVEFLRDSLLYLAGDLDLTLGGAELPVAAAEDGTRRTIYYRYARDDQIKFLTFFDAPNVDECYRRRESIVPQQALAMSNSKLVLSLGRKLAARVSAEVGEASAADARGGFVLSAFERVLGRAPARVEREECLAALEEFTTTPASRKLEPAEAERHARENLIHVLLNHNDFITIR